MKWHVLSGTTVPLNNRESIAGESKKLLFNYTAAQVTDQSKCRKRLVLPLVLFLYKIVSFSQTLVNCQDGWDFVLIIVFLF